MKDLTSILFVVLILTSFVGMPEANALAHGATANRPPTNSDKSLTFQPEMNHAELMSYAYQFYNDDESEEEAAKREADQASLTQAQIWERMVLNGWPDSLSNFKLRFKSGKSYLTLYKKLPQNPIDMRSPNRFKNSMSSNEVIEKSSSIGHMSIGWSCDEPQSSSRSEGFAAQTGEDGGQSGDMLTAGWGMTAAISTFTDGQIQNAAHVQAYFSNEYVNLAESNKKTNAYFALVVEVPTTDCVQVREFVKSYVMHPAKPYRNFGMLPDPLKYEGAGCGSFAVAALAHSKTLEPVMATFWRTLPIPEKILGRLTKADLPNEVEPAVYAKTQAQKKVIGKLSLIPMNWDSGKTEMNIHLVDPELTIYAFRIFGTMASQMSREKISKYQAAQLRRMVRNYNFNGGNGEATDFSNKDSGYQEIDDQFDPSFSRVSTTIRQWLSANPQTSNLNLVSFPFGVGVMIDSKSN